MLELLNAINGRQLLFLDIHGQISIAHCICGFTQAVETFLEDFLTHYFLRHSFGLLVLNSFPFFLEVVSHL